MFPLNVTTIGCGVDLLQLLRLELSVQSGRVEADYPSIEDAITALRQPVKAADGSNRVNRKSEPFLGSPAKRLFIVQLVSVQDLPAVKRLSSFFQAIRSSS